MNFATEVDAVARDAPDALAVADPDRGLTYREFARETAAFADALDGLGVVAGDRVALYLSSSVPFLSAYLGAMKRGAVPVPVNLRLTVHQIDALLEDVGATAVVTDGRVESAAAALDVSTLEHTVVANGDRGLSYEDLVADADGGYDPVPRKDYELAEILYTRGTTGEPKPVMHTHGAIAASARATGHYCEWSRHEVGLTVCPCFHAVGLHGTATPLVTAGATNHFPGEWDESVLELIDDRGVTVTAVVPSMLADVLDHGTGGYDLSSLAQVIVTGGPLPTERIEAAADALGCDVVVAYGTTETMPLTALSRPGEDLPPNSAGRPAAGVVDLRVEDPRTGSRVEAGGTGELLWSGDTVTPGYWESPADNDDLFVERDGEYWLRSGDLGRLEDGVLVVEDRLRDAVLTDGGIVSTGDVEEVIYEFDGVREAAVVDATADRGETDLRALVQRGPDPPTAAEIKDRCRDRLDAHEVPDAVEFTDRLPASALRAMNARSRDGGDWFDRTGGREAGP